ncbi:glucosyl-dolichyl phosphate glucuronosyltransferase [Haloarculaceae archaeon H-GB2-1]|nr:glucosyl-dolichyl phosphate glucuronosyltransferase [Haloarculaceae archaeon H-GB1-1]MEA5408005.1 glucosyl-dolichyl phosphate glucuronosyltransferase [Haloarculaceae archaeon H-GB2-1]
MRVSVVLCAHTMDRFDAVTDAAESVFAQTYDDVELVFVSDGNETVASEFRELYGDRDDVVVHCNDENVGLLESRNTGAEVASGDVVAFIDDDAVADDEWIERLTTAYEDQDAVAAGGTMAPEWVAGKPSFLPEEFYWLVGVTHRGFADGPGEVRNTFGSNISFRRDVFLELDGFDANIGGRQGDANLQGGETELCARLQDEYGKGVYYVPDARVAHKVFEYRTDPWWLLDRAFWQGYSKRGMEKFVPASTGEETDFLGQLVGEFVPSRVSGLVTNPSVAALAQFVWLFLLTAAVGSGYLYGVYKWG